MKKIFLFLLLLGSAFLAKAQVPVSQPQYFLKWIRVHDSIRAPIYFQDPNDTLATRAYARGFAGGSALAGGYAIRISGDTVILDTAHYRKMDSLYVITDSTFIIKINGITTAFKMRGSVFSFNGRAQAVLPLEGDYAQFYPKLDTTYNDPTWITHLNFSKLINLPNTLAGHNIINGVMNAGGGLSWGSGTLSSRPIAGNNGAFYFSTTDTAIYFDNGVVWTKISTSGGGGGSGLDSAIIAGFGINKSVVGTVITLKMDTNAIKSFIGTLSGIVQIFATRGVIIGGTDTVKVDTTVVIPWSDTSAANGMVTKNFLSTRGYLLTETDPVAQAKNITETQGSGILIAGTAGQSLGSGPSWTFKADTALLSTKFYVNSQGFISAETDPIATAKVITETQGSGILITGTAGQTLIASPSWTFKADTALLSTKWFATHQGYISSEADPIAIAKVITINQGSGILMTGIAGQTLGSSPIWTLRVDSALFSTHNYIAGLNYFTAPSGSTSQYLQGNGAPATTDTSMIPTFYAKVRSEIHALGPWLWNATTGTGSIDTSAGLSHAVTQNMLFNSMDTFRIVHHGALWLSYPGNADTVNDKGYRNTGNVQLFTASDSSLFGNVDSSKVATIYMVTHVPVTNIVASGYVGTGLKTLFDDGTWKTAGSGGGNTNITVFPTATGDSVRSSTGSTGFLPLGNYTNAGAIPPGELQKIDSIVYVANTRQGDSTAYFSGDTIYWKGMQMVAGSNISVTPNHTQKKLSYTIGLSASYHGQTSIDTLGTVGIGTWQATPIQTPYGGVPTAGLTAQILVKNSNTNYDYSWATPTFLTDPTTTQGDIIYRNATAGPTGLVRLPGNIVTQRSFLMESGTGSAAGNPSWYTPIPGDVIGWLAFTPENVANKSNAALGTSTTLYPTDAAVKTYVDGAPYLPIAGGSFTGTAGAGFLGLINQSSNPTTPAGGVRIFNNLANSFSFKGVNAATYTFLGTGTGNNTYQFPDLGGSSDNVITQTAVQSMSNKSFINLANQSSNPATPAGGVDLFTNLANTFSFVGTNGVIGTISFSGLTGNRAFALPDGSANIVTDAATQTLANKTLTSPILNLGSDATGDIYYRNSSGLLTRLPAGSNGQVLGIASGIPAYLTIPSTPGWDAVLAASGTLSTNRTITNTGFTLTHTGGIDDFTGATIKVTTQSPGNNSTNAASTAYADAENALKANIASPTFTGTASFALIAGTTASTGIAGGSGAGSGSSISVLRANSITGQISILAGSGAVAGGVVCTVTIPNQNSANYLIYLTSAGTNGIVFNAKCVNGTTFTINVDSPSVSLANGSTYVINYEIIQ